MEFLQSPGKLLSLQSTIDDQQSSFACSDLDLYLDDLGLEDLVQHWCMHADLDLGDLVVQRWDRADLDVYLEDLGLEG